MFKSNKLLIVVISIIILLLFLSIGFILLILPLYTTPTLTNKANSSSISLGNKKLIVLVSLDGFGSNLIGENTPYINSLLLDPNTSYTLDMQTLVQSETMPSHMSMVTGLTQERHGFYKNSVDLSTPALTSKTIFDYGVDNNYSYFSLVTKEKLLYLSSSIKDDNIRFIDGMSGDVIDDIDNLVETNDNKVLVFLHFRDIDTTGHASGWGSVVQDLALKTLDANLKMLINDFEAEFNNYESYYIFTADHGGEGMVHSSGCANCRRIPFIVKSDNVENKYVLNHSSYNIYDVACTVIDMMDLDKVPDMDCKR